MQGGAAKGEPRDGVVDGAALGDFDAFATGEVLAGEGFAGLEHFGAGSLEDDGAAGFATAGAEFDNLIGDADDAGFVFDDDDGVAGVAQAFEDAGEALGVAGMEANAGFVEDEQGVDEAGTEAGGEVDTLSFAAGERARLAVEGEVAEANFLEIAEAGAGFIKGEASGSDFLERGREAAS